jgi:hypothetical protein
LIFLSLKKNRAKSDENSDSFRKTFIKNKLRFAINIFDKFSARRVVNTKIYI